MRLKGYSLGLIANILNSEEFPTKFGKQWTPHAVRIVLLKFMASPAQQAQVRDMGEFTLTTTSPKKRMPEINPIADTLDPRADVERERLAVAAAALRG